MCEIGLAGPEHSPCGSCGGGGGCCCCGGGGEERPDGGGDGWFDAADDIDGGERGGGGGGGGYLAAALGGYAFGCVLLEVAPPELTRAALLFLVPSAVAAVLARLAARGEWREALGLSA